MHNTTGDVTLMNIRRETKKLKTRLYMHNTTGDVTLTNIRRETKY